MAFADGDGIMPVARHVRETLEQSEVAQCVVFHACRTHDTIAQLEELQALKNRYVDRVALHYFLSDERQEIEFNEGLLDAARLHRIFTALLDPADVDECLVSGPPETASGIAVTLREIGIAEPLIITTCADDLASTSRQTEARPDETRECAVTLIMDGRSRSFTMDATETVLEAAERNGIALPFSCRGGVCATCRTRVTRGAVTMDANYALEDWELEAGFILACQSHPKAPELVLTYDER